MRQTFIKLFAILCWAACSLCFTACRKPAECDTIRIGLLEGPSAVSFIELLNRDTEIDGKRIRLVVKSEPLQLQALMMRGEVDFAVLPTVMAANLYNKGVKYRMIACPIWGTLYVLSGVPEIRSVRDLRGESISVFGQGSTADVLTKRMIKRENLDSPGIDYRFASNEALAQALLAGETRVAAVSEPLVSRLLREDPRIHIVGKLNCGGAHFEDSPKNYFVQSAFVVSERFVNDHPDLIADVCSAYRSSCNFVNGHPDEAASLLVRHGLAPDRDTALQSIDLCNIQYVAAFAFMRELYHFLHICHTEYPESVGGHLPDTGFIYQGH